MSQHKFLRRVLGDRTTVLCIVLMTALGLSLVPAALGQTGDVFSAGNGQSYRTPVGPGYWIKLGPQQVHGSNGPYMWVPRCDELRDHWLYGIVVYGNPQPSSNGNTHTLYSGNPASGVISPASPSSITDPRMQQRFQLYARQQQLVIGHPCNGAPTAVHPPANGWNLPARIPSTLPRPPTGYPAQPDLSSSAVCRPGGPRGIDRPPFTLRIQIPAQFSIFVPGLQNIADNVNFLSTYHPVETAYVGIAIAGGRLAAMPLPVPLTHVSVQQVIGGELYTAEAAAVNECDAAVSRDAPGVLGLDRPISTSLTQNAELQADIAELERMGATQIRVNQQQVNAAGQRVGINRPDLQFTYKGVRHYVEYDRSSSGRGPLHGARLMANDPQGVVVLKKVN